MGQRPVFEDLEQKIKALKQEVAECRGAEEALRDSEAHYRAIVEAFEGLIYICSSDYRVEFMNARFIERIGRDATGELCYEALHDRKSVCPWCANEKVFKGRTVRWEFRDPKDNRWYYIVDTPICHPNGSVSKQSMILDITKRKRAENLLTAERKVLEMVASGCCTLRETLNALTLMIEQLSPGIFCSVLLFDEKNGCLLHGAAPSLPEEYIRAIDGIVVGSRAGSCGTAVYRGEKVIVEDTETDPLWNDYRDLARRYGLRACWSLPIYDSGGKILGTFALYDSKPHRPSEEDLQLVEAAAHLASIVIERNRAEEALWESEEKYRDIFEESRDAIYITRRDGKFLDANRSTLELFGYTAEEMRNVNIKATYVNADDRKIFQREIEEKGSVRDYELKLRKKDGTQMDCLLTATVRKDSEGNVLGYQGIIRDISEKKRAEKALRESEERYRSLFENSPISLWEEDFSLVKERIENLKDSGIRDFRTYFRDHPDEVAHCANLVKIVDVNKATLELYGAASVDDFRRGLSLIFDKRSYDVFREELIAIAEGRTWFEDEAVNQTLAGDKKYISLRWSVAPGYEKNLSKVLISIVDISDLKTLERERANLISMFAHDMKSALVIIHGFTSRLLTKGAEIDEEKQKRYLDIVCKETEKLEFLVTDFLEFSRLQTGNLRLNFNPIFLDKELLDLLEAYQAKALDRGITLEIRNVNSLPVIEADANRLRRVFTNLLDNAFKFSKEKGTITIDAHKEEQNVIVRVIDHGIGINPQDLPYLFDPFHRGQGVDKYEGYGVGLAAVKTIVEGHGGHILVDSKPGRGSVFTVVLPKKRTPAA